MLKGAVRMKIPHPYRRVDWQSEAAWEKKMKRHKRRERQLARELRALQGKVEAMIEDRRAADSE